MQIDFILDYIQKNNILYIKNDNEKNMIKNKIINYESDILFSFKFWFRFMIYFLIILK